MNITLSQNAHYLLKHVLTTTGDKEIAPDGKEINSPLRLCGEETAQRRHYLKVIDPLLEAKRKEVQENIDEAKEAWKTENEQGKTEDKAYEALMNAAVGTDKELIEKINLIADGIIEVDLTDKTVEVLKRYFKEFGDKNGYTVGDDKSVEEISKAFDN